MGDSRSVRRAARRYGAALLSMAVALLVRWPLYPVLGGERPYLTLFGGVAFAVWFGRWRPAALAAVAGFIAANYFIVPPRDAVVFDASLIVEMVAYSVSSGLIILFGEAMHRAREAEFGKTHELAVTLASIGDGVIATDPQGRVSSMNAEAERLTRWKASEAAGRPLSDVFRIVNERTRQPAENPVDKVIARGTVVGLANHTLLLAKDGTELPIDDSAAPIRTAGGPLLGVVLVFRDSTEQRKAEEARTRLATIIESSGEAIFSKRLDGTVETWNPAAERMFGFRAEEIVGKPVALFIPPDLLDEEERILGRIREGHPYERVETVRLAKDGRRVPVLLGASPLKNDAGEVIGVSKIIHDITEIIAAREALAREKGLLHTTLASIGDGVIVTDARGRVSFLNAEAERLTGWKNAEARGQELPIVFRIVHEETRASVENPVDKVFRLGTVVGLANHTVLIAKDGTETAIDDSAAPIREPGGPLFGVVLVFRDFTEQKQAEQALRASELRLQTALSAGRMGTWEWTVATGRVAWSPALEHIHGLDPGTFYGTFEGFKRDVHPDDLTAVIARIQSALQDRGGYSITYRIRRPDGTERWLEAHGSVLLDARGEPEKMAGVCMDITERKRAEEELGRLNAGLENTVQERTAKLREMVDELQHVSYAITHDMRAPLRAMSVFAELLLESAGTLTPESQDYCRRILTAAARLDRLIRDALNYSRAVLQQLPLEPVDLSKLVRGLLETYPNLHSDKAEIRIEGGLPILLGNEALLTQCFSNLLGNAVKFVAPGVRPQVRVRCDLASGRARVWVEDNGVGIPKHAQHRLFGMFQKLDDQFEGTGIGLAIVRKVVERMGGGVGVESEPGKGSRFWVELRCASGGDGKHG